jgi:competence protein ComEC
MRFWNKYPFFRLIIPFAAGILLAIHLPKPSALEMIHLILICCALFLAALAGHFLSAYQYRWLSGFFIYVFTFAAGYSLTIVQTEKYYSSHHSNYLNDGQVYVVRVSEPPSERARSVRVFGKVRYVMDSVTSRRTIGKVLMYFEKDSTALQLEYGDLLMIQTRISPTEPPGNPHQFNYKKFLANSGVYHQAYVRSDSWRQIDSNLVNFVFDFSFKARAQMMRILEKNGLTGNEFAVISAILLGFDDLMEPELREKYAGAGALHVLCVSGLHVGIIFFIMNFLLKRLDRKKRGRIIKFLVLILSIWAYAFITGLSPSVMRAGVMFSLFSWRELSKEKSNPYNVLAASAFILLAIDPYLITKIGFQLSYAAVLAIISMFDPIYKLLVFKNVVADYFWKLAVVSIAAQAGTFPLAIFYFNQFPLYFLLTNFIVIPLVWLILYTGIFTIILSAIWSGFSMVAGKLLYYEVWALNFSVDWVNTLPHAKIDGLVLLLPQVILVYLLIILAFHAYVRKYPGYLIGALSVAVLLMVGFVYQRYETLQQKKLVIYQVNGYSAIDVFFGNRLIALADSALLTDTKALEFNIEDNRLHSGARMLTPSGFRPENLKMLNLIGSPVKYYSPNLLLAGKKRIAIVDETFANYHPVKPLEADLVLLRQNTDVQIARIAEMFAFERLIFDNSNAPWVVDRWRSYCDEHNIPYYDIREKGAFVQRL